MADDVYPASRIGEVVSLGAGYSDRSVGRWVCFNEPVPLMEGVGGNDVEPVFARFERVKGEESAGAYA